MTNNNAAEATVSYIFKLSGDQLSLSILTNRSQVYLQKIEQDIRSSLENIMELNHSKPITYIWALEAKEVAILFRDCILNLLRLKYIEQEGIKTKEEVKEYKEEVSKRLFDASKHLDDLYSDITAGKIKSDPKWLHEKNPSGIILKQLHHIQDQIKKIYRSQHKLDQIEQSFSAFKKSFNNAITIRIQRSKELKATVEKITNQLNSISDVATKIEIDKLVNTIDNHVAILENQSNMSSFDNISLDNIDKINLPISSEGGILNFKQIDILSEVSPWTTFNLSGPLREMDEQLRLFKEKVAVTFLQLSNRLKAKVDLSSNGSVDLDKVEICKPLEKLDKDFVSVFESEFYNKTETLKQKMHDSINVNRLFDEKNLFLPMSMINQLSSSLTFRESIQRRYNYGKIIEELHTWTKGIFKRELKEECTAASYIDSIISFNPLEDQNALFLKKGFLGSSFNIIRPAKLDAIKNHIELWGSGFGGSLLITGNHNSGKSSLLELIHNQHPEITNYNVVIGQSLDVNGHKFKVDNDLIKALKEIVKYADGSRCMICIDNMNDYISDPFEMYDLFNALQSLIIKYAHKIYFALVVEKSQYERLDQYFKLENVFTEIINTNGMPSGLIADALYVRALAVADHDEVTFNSDKLRQKAIKIARHSHGNIGLAMETWCANNDDFKKISARGFESKILSYKMILEYLLSFGKIKIVSLKLMFDGVEFANIRADIEHLCQQKILIRKGEGYIQVNPFLRSQISNILGQINSI